MKKLKILGLSFLAALIVFFDYQFSFIPILVLFLSLFILYYGATYWILESDINKEGWFTLLLFPSIMMASEGLALKLYTFPFFHDLHVRISGEGILVFLLFFASMTLVGYLLILTMNIFNVSRYKRLPLLQAAQTILYVCTSVGGYIGFNLAYFLFSTHWSIFLLVTTAISGYLIFINTWGLKKPFKDMVILTFIGIYVIGQLAFVLLLFPLRPYFIPLVASLGLYIYNGMVIRMSKHKHLKASWVEYIALAIIVILLVLYTSKWGVAGNVVGL